MQAASREQQRAEHNEQKELESLRRVFEQLDKTKVGKIGFKELNDQLIKLDYRAKRVEVEDMIWEVDEDCDHCVSWDEFKLMFHRCRNDRTGLEPRKLFNVVEFMMHDKVYPHLNTILPAAAVLMPACRIGLIWHHRYGRVHGNSFPPFRQRSARRANK